MRERSNGRWKREGVERMNLINVVLSQGAFCYPLHMASRE